jgi:hypothetical protein
MIGFDIDERQLRGIADEFEASEKDLRRAFSRALSRTSTRLRTQARKHLREGLNLRAAAVLKARLRLARYRPRGSGMGAARLWVGTNDLPASAFKGTPRETATGARVGGRSFEGAFVGRGSDSGKRLVFRRRGRARLPVAQETVPVQDEMDQVLERQVFTEVDELMARNFRAELRARTIYKVG